MIKTIRVGAEIIVIENGPKKKTQNLQKIGETQSWFFENIGKIYKLLAILNKKREDTH